MRWRLLTVLPAAATALVLGAGSASAHECFNASRSGQGNASAGGNSQAWTSLESIARSFLPADQADCVLGELAAAGVSPTLAVHVKGANGQGGVIAENNPNEEHAADGQGIDHLFEAYGPEFGAAFMACGVPLDG